MTRQQFDELTAKGVVILDGATGSNLRKAGMPVGISSEQWVLENPSVLQELQRAYVDAGSQIVYAPTFAANPISLRNFSLQDRVAELNTKLVKICKDGIGNRALVAGDITTTGQLMEPRGTLTYNELDEAYQQFLKKMKAEGKLDEDKINEANSAKAMNNDTKTAEIVKFPGFRNEASKEENLKDAQSTESSAEEIDFIAGFSDKLCQFEKEENKLWYKYGKAAGIAVLAAIGILAGSMASQADSAKFVSSVQHIINSEDVMP